MNQSPKSLSKSIVVSGLNSNSSKDPDMDCMKSDAKRSCDAGGGGTFTCDGCDPGLGPPGGPPIAPGVGWLGGPTFIGPIKEAGGEGAVILFAGIGVGGRRSAVSRSWRLLRWHTGCASRRSVRRIVVPRSTVRSRRSFRIAHTRGWWRHHSHWFRRLSWWESVALVGSHRSEMSWNTGNTSSWSRLRAIMVELLVARRG